ncbi:MAG: excinuclease ABC subunit C [Firmicutes bacterium HGW-Firmicutes-1]|jgi:excinuclease ABC subunit C|nr:MAG: excinuclease ABC subunit C [Firmicutes bacterium HGW-Firmicutes-1]
MFDINEELKKLPLKPGVYLMKDEKDHIIYVGKAILLKNRVRQYFRNSANHTAKIKNMVAQIRSFEYIVTDSELEALILECNLIKKHRPKYNTMLKDDKMYPYIKVTVNEAYPRVIFTRTMQKDKAKYFGPYASAFAAKETIELMRKIWRIRSCNRKLPEDIGKERPCLYYHIGQCDAPCQGYISSQDYKANIDEVVGFLSGKYEPITNMLEEKMLQASEDLDFEKAVEYRDQLTSVKAIAQKQKIINSAMEDQDVIAFAKIEQEALVQVYFIRNGKMIGREHFHLNDVEDLSGTEIITTFVKQFYSGTPFIPKELILQEELEEAYIISQWLSDKRGQKVYIKVPQKGEKNKLIELAAKNAMLSLQQFGNNMKQKEVKTKGALMELAQLLDFEDSLIRVEAYDISNTQGFESVGSMIVFEEGVPKRSDYRKFKIKSVMGPDDYASLEEVLTRRFTRALEEQKEILEKGLESGYGKFTRLPDLILMDGGKGQVNIALRVMEKIGLEIPICGMIKDDHHNTRGLIYHDQEIVLSKHSEAFKLVTRIQDEAHRFAIEYHKKLRAKNQVASILNTIEGIGPTRRKNLLLHFGSVEKIKHASVEELNKVDAMNKKTAEIVYHFFHIEQEK